MFYKIEEITENTYRFDENGRDVSEKDNNFFNRMTEGRIYGMMMAVMEKQKIQPYHNKKMGKAMPLHDGDIFDLGNRQIEVQEIPGHTAGSVMFVDHAQKLMFTGDDVNVRLWMQEIGATTLREWKASAIPEVRFNIHRID